MDSSQNNSLDQNNLNNTNSNGAEQNCGSKNGNLKVTECVKPTRIYDEPTSETQTGRREDSDKDENEVEQEAEGASVRGLRRGRRLIPTKEDKTNRTALGNNVDCPEFGYIAANGSFVTPF